ncbi:hypothetical protein ACVI1N_003508 [Sinorhizobium medicae]
MTGELFLAIDVGTGSVRAALIDVRGKIVEIAAREHDQIVPQSAGRSSGRSIGGRAPALPYAACSTRRKARANASP